MKTMKKILSKGWILGIFLVLGFRFVYTPITISGNSMFPTLHDGDYYFSRSLSFSEVDKNDIVVLRTPNTSKLVIKRIIAESGDKVLISDKGIFVNGDLVDNSKLTKKYLSEKSGFMFSNKDIEFTLKKDWFFVLGDNRENSTDSRSYGLVSIGDIQGELEMRFPNLISKWVSWFKW